MEPSTHLADLAQAVCVAGFSILVLVFAVLKMAFRFLSPVAAEGLAEQAGGGEDSFLRKSLLQPTPLWFSLQIGGLLSLLGLAASLAARPLFAPYGLWTPLHALAVAVLAVLLFISLELVLPLLLVRGRADRVILRALPLLHLVHGIFSPISRRLAARIEEPEPAGPEAGEKEEEVTEEEVDAFIEVGEREGILDEGQKDMVRGVVEFGETVVREIMTPRTDLHAVPSTALVEEVCRLMTESKHTKIPVYAGNADSIEGVLHVKDLLASLLAGRGKDPAAPLARKTLYVPETTPVSSLLRELQKERLSMAVVVDEYGGTAGIATVEDILEELVGEIQDEHEAAPPEIHDEGGGLWSVDGRASLYDLREILREPLEVGEDVDTAGGYVVAQLGRVPRKGEKLVVPGLELRIVDADERRVLRMHIRKTGNARDQRDQGTGNAAGA